MAPKLTILPGSDYRRKNRKYWLYVPVGVLYGLAIRWIAGRSWFDRFEVMSFGFVIVVPIVMGFISVFLAERESRQPLKLWFFLPWFVVSVALLGTLITAWEGAICVVLLAPLAWILGSLGGLLGGLAARMLKSPRAQTGVLAVVLLLPMMVSPLTQRLLRSEQIQTVHTSIDIQAPADIVWHNIERVPKIQKNELTSTWSRRIGFPAPDEATLSYEGVGAIRHATFAGGVLFIEKVDIWQPNQHLAFSIHAETERIPNTTLDQHVRVGGPYFDVLHGDYEIESLPNGWTRLHLSSRHRVSTDFNWYAHLWTDAIMRDIQNSILEVIKNRCETQARNKH